MAIVKMSKFSLFAFDSERENLLHELQKFGYVHFDSLDDEELLSEGLDTVDMPESIGEVDEEISKVKYAIELLSKYDERETGIKSLIKGKENLTFEELEERASNFDYLPIYNQLRVLSSKLDGIDQETIKLNSLIEELSHWKGLNYPIKDLRNFKQCEVFMGTIPKKMKDKLNLDLLDLEYTYVELLNEDKDNIYLFALTLNDEKEKLNDILRRNGYSSIKLNIEGIPKEHIASIEEKIKSLNMEKQNIISQIKELSKHIANFEVSYEYLMNRKLRLAISENFLATSYVTVINGYVPTDMEDEFKKIVLLNKEKEHLGVYISDHPLNAYKSLIDMIDHTSLNELEQIEKRNQVNKMTRLTQNTPTTYRTIMNPRVGRNETGIHGSDDIHGSVS